MNVNPTNTYWFNKSMYDYHDNRITSLQKRIQKHKTKRAHYNAVLSENVEWLGRWQEHVQEVVTEQAKERSKKRRQITVAQTKIAAKDAADELKKQVAKADEVKVTVKRQPANKTKKTSSRKTPAEVTS